MAAYAAMAYAVVDGKIRSRVCELNLSSHCNLSCRGCSHLSPVLPRGYLDPARVHADLSSLARHYRAGAVKLLGGEPLLHPAILEVIAAARGSGVAKRVIVATNGVLLPRMSEAFWEAIDEVLVSQYPGRELSPEQLERCREQAQAHQVRLESRRYTQFRVPYSEVGTSDAALVERIYRTCEIAHAWRCHAVEDGYFYKCPPAIFLPRTLGDDARLSPPTLDGLKIEDSPEFGRSLLAYLTSEQPLASCAYCLGTVGKRLPHEQVPRVQWRGFQAQPTEQLISLELLTRREADLAARAGRDPPPRVRARRGVGRSIRRRLGRAVRSIKARVSS